MTFDDGYADNLFEALPILESTGAQALFFISTGLVDSDREFWWDALTNVFFEQEHLPQQLTLEVRDQRLELNTAIPIFREQAFKTVHDHMKQLPEDEREPVIKKLFGWAGLPVQGRRTHRILSSYEIEIMGKSPAAVIGCHTDSHSTLSTLIKDQQRKDISPSKRKLEEILKDQVRYFSYPFGTRKDFDIVSEAVVKELGFRAAFSNYQQNIRKGDNLYRLPRRLVRNWALPDFALQVKTFFLQ